MILDNFSAIYTVIEESFGMPNGTKISKKDTRRTTGVTDHAQAMHMKSEVECGRKYCSSKKTKLFKGKLLSFEMTKVSPVGTTRDNLQV